MTCRMYSTYAHPLHPPNSTFCTTTHKSVGELVKLFHVNFLHKRKICYTQDRLTAKTVPIRIG